ncbi:PD-(D/E)XK nuclease family protein [Candidatus Palauibacter polyketidifaciens]|uniref:PD-(D/E)XK nuclease family protein n=1 Tax=Candidatus Palauibacter polyketidifaciens TaxID=3056740 RepID=UPI002393076B|nr:PD-(D/E)XK nuclease family protein [Candidatus Palauibacter polyketidifaciens]MDE2721456.1 PD-(D/E)XK nuclease family protein [Candidatus Palauibacter polyketidifaciens]
MTLNVVRAPAAAPLWEGCVDRFLAQAASSAEAGAGAGAWIWLNHRSLRDLLFEAAHERGLPGWLDPPVTLFGELTDRFGIREKSVGLLTRRRLVSRHAARLGQRILGREPGRGDGVIRGHMLDRLFGDLLPEGVPPDELERALARLGGDDFARRRNDWAVAVYRAYLAALEKRGFLDRRSVNARIAERIEAGGLAAAIGGARELHVYSIASPRTRRRMLEALSRQEEVDVHLYLPSESEPDRFFDELADRTEVIGVPRDGGEDGGGGAGAGAGPVTVQPVPDAAREMAWVARQVKEILAAGTAEPHRIAVVARSGRENTHRAYRALRRAGVSATARIRTPLDEVPALRALLLVLRGVGRNWDYRSLRALLAHPYFDTRVDLRSIDAIAALRRVVGLESWTGALEQLRPLVENKAREVRGRGLFLDRVEKDIEAFGALREVLDPLADARSEADWIDLTLALLREDRGVFRLRRRVCDPVEERWEVVRSDQRGILLLERLLREWRELDHPDDPLPPAGWHALLGKLLQANELVLSTPGQKGVQVLEAHDAALVPFAHTFVVHANDREFPRAGGATGVFTDTERRRLAALGLPLAHRDETLRRERGLWRAVTQQAGPVCISYRTTDAGGTPLLPSLMVPSHEDAAELPRIRRPSDELDPVTPAEADRRAAFAIHRALGVPDPTERPRIAPARPERVARAIVAAAAEIHRGPGLERYPGFLLPAPSPGPAMAVHPAFRPNPWNGHLRDPDVLRELERRFHDDYRWSAGQLEAYARSPFTFLVERVLWLEGVEEAEEETTPLTFGSVAHEILERFYAEFMGRLPVALEGSVEDRLAEISAEVCAERAEKGEWLGVASLWEQTREGIVAAVRNYIEWELGHMARKGECPIETEVGFGFDDERAMLAGTDIRGRAARLRICGRIDRLDRDAGGTGVFHVLDYKSGKPPPAPRFDDATALQGVLYAQVMADRGYAMGSCRYRSIRSPGSPLNGGLVRFGEERYDRALTMALSIPARVRAGCFEAVVSRKGDWWSWDPPREVRRSDAQIAEGHRFDDFGDDASG